MKCSCGRFEVPQCCRRYLEDALGNLVHTELVCYEQVRTGEWASTEGSTIKFFIPRTVDFIPLNITITDKEENG